MCYLKQFILLIILFSISFFLVSCSGNSEQEREKPNIVLIMVDDLNDWVGFMGGYSGDVYTPNIDRLASQGMAFNNAHASAPACNPSRTALLLGKLPSTTGVYNNGQWWKPIYPEEITLPQYFKEHGYYTAGAGKVFHHTTGNNPPVSWNDFQDQVFDDPWNFAEWDPERYFVDYGYRGPMLEIPSWSKLNEIYSLRLKMDWGPIPGKAEKEYGDVQAANYAQDFLQKSHNSPFFLAIGIYRPHIPWFAPKKYFDMYPVEKIVLPEVHENDLDDIPEAGQQIANRYIEFEEIQGAGKWEEAVQAYLASISFADAQVGSVLNALEESEYSDNTIVVLVSDHGFHHGQKEHWHKQSLWEEATRIPFIVKVPGVTQPGSVSDESVDMLSIYPTLVTLAGLPDKADLEGHNLTPFLQNPDTQWNYPAITIHGKENIAIRSRNWRYIRYQDGGEELYNHQEDPNEWTNLAGKEEYSKVIDEHKKWIPSSFKDPIPNKRDWFFDPYEYTWLHRETGQFIDGKK